MEEFLQKAVDHLYNVHQPADIETALRTLPALLIHSPTAPSLSLTPKAFFVAFHGTLTLAFTGWPQSLCNTKTLIDTRLSHVLLGENAGTRWPKVTLGVLGEGVKLEEGEARRLLEVITNLNRELLSKSQTHERIDSLDIVLYNVKNYISVFITYVLLRNVLLKLDPD
jgi:hypothetical protein